MQFLHVDNKDSYQTVRRENAQSYVYVFYLKCVHTFFSHYNNYNFILQSQIQIVLFNFIMLMQPWFFFTE